MAWDQWRSLGGLGLLLAVAWALSESRWKISWRLVVSGIALQLVVAFALLRTRAGAVVYHGASDAMRLLIQFSNEGTAFLFGEAAMRACPALGFLPPIVFMASLAGVLFHLGVLQWIVWAMARLMAWVMNVSGTESLAAAANVFVGMTEAPLLVQPYLATMTRSEIVAMMTSGMATIAGGVMAVYASMLLSAGVDPGHLFVASLISAPASLVVAKVLVPEREVSPTKGAVEVSVRRESVNVLDAACRGATEGVKLAINVAAMLIAFLGLLAMLNWAMGLAPDVGGSPLTLQRILGWLFAPVAWCLGVAWGDCPAVGALLGEKTILNEFIAYDHLSKQVSQLQPRSVVIATYALCGFANFGSVAIQIGGVGALEPTRRADFARYGLLSLVGGTLSAFMTAAVAGFLGASMHQVGGAPLP